MPMNPMTRSTKTQRMYDLRVKTTMHRYHQETQGSTWADNPMAFAEWMLAQKDRWKRSTWRMTRLAVREYLQKEGAPMEALHLFDDGHNPPGNAKGQIEAARIKGLPDKDLFALIDLLTNPETQAANNVRKGTYDAILSAFLQANVLTGMRPSEWDTAAWATLDKETVLRVDNRKATNGRGNGVARLLSVHPDAIPVIQAMMDERDRLYALGITWPEMQNGMASRLKDIRHLVTKKTYTLYSTRHRFASAAKQSGYSRRDIAEMLGHASDKTAIIHYGRKKTTIRNAGTDSEQEKPLMGVTKGIGVRPESGPEESESERMNDEADRKVGIVVTDSQG